MRCIVLFACCLQICKDVVELIVALFEVLYCAQDFFISLVIAESIQALCQLCQFLCVSSVVGYHIFDECLQLSFGTVSMVVCAVVIMEMIMGVRMFMIVGVLMSMFVSVCYAIVGMLVGMTVSMGMGVAAVVAMFMGMTVFVIMHNILL